MLKSDQNEHVISDMSFSLIRLISSQPQRLDENYFTTTDFNGLAQVLDALLSVACETPTPPPTGCGSLIVDLVFVVDSSGSICDTSPECANGCSGTCENWKRVNLFMNFLRCAYFAELYWNSVIK